MGAGWCGNCSSGMDSSILCVKLFITLEDFDVRWGVCARESGGEEKGGRGEEGFPEV